MAYDDEHKSSAELQREIDMQRNQVENRIDQIADKLSPGQLVDELMAYTKGGGGEFIGSLQRSVTANPLPVALLGVSLAWLMAKPGGSSKSTRTTTTRAYGDDAWDDSINARRGYGATDYDTESVYIDEEFYDDEDYPVATISGTSMQRLGSVSDDAGRNYSEFTDDSGKKFRALTDKAGQRAGHFVDEAGNRFKGFADASGQQVQHFRDEAGNLLDAATGWASHTWRQARRKLHDARDALSSGASHAGHAASGLRSQAGHAGNAIRHQAGYAGSTLRHGAGSLNHTLMDQFRQQPLVAGALAFAAGAAIAASLPHTEQEDALLGETADQLKATAAEQANQVYEQGREKATELYETATGKAGEIYQQAKEGVTNVASTATTSSTGSTGTSSTGESTT
ncbi:MAG: nutrient deprivation-induced protein [Devosia sp.]|jgi:hypothetical protein|nr:nutrient deprivation-induced protein [Devosia sp.]